MREYEVTVIIQPKLEEQQRTEQLELITSWLTIGEEEGDKPVANHWGERRLAYPIEDHNSGYYVMFEAKLNPADIPELEQKFKYQEDLLRYLVIRKEG